MHDSCAVLIYVLGYFALVDCYFRKKKKTMRYRLQWGTWRPPWHLASKAPQPTRRLDTSEWNSQVFDAEMGKQWPDPDTGRQSGSPGDKPYCIKVLARLIHWGRDKMAAIFPTTFSNIFSWMKMYKFCLRFHWNLFPRVQLTIFHHWFR